MAQRDILTITLNPALDLSTSTDSVRPGTKLRCAALSMDPGGGGINVSRAIAYMGGRSRPVVALGGDAGQSLGRLLAAEGLEPEILAAPGETRTSFAVTDRASGGQYRFVMPGPEWSREGAQRALHRSAQLAGEGALVVLSGSQPPGVEEDFALELAGLLSARGAQLVVDTSGAALAAVTARAYGARRPALLRFDDEEASLLAGRAVTSPEAAGDFAAALVRRGIAGAVMIACGAQGSVLASETERLLCRPPLVPVVSAIGAGDSFVAAAVLALSRGGGFPDALRHGVAAAAAAVMTPATRLCRAGDVEALLPGCRLENLPG